MALTINEMEEAVEDARRTFARADMVAGKLAKMLAGRLRKADIPTWVLKDLKKELADFNAHTGSWKQ